MNNPKRGGKRPGAGRPPTVKASIRVTVTLDQETVDILKSISTNISKAIRTLAKGHSNV